MLSHAYAMSIYSAQKNVHIVNPYFCTDFFHQKGIEPDNRPGSRCNNHGFLCFRYPFTPDAALYKLHKLMKRGATVYMYNGGFHHSKI